MFTNSDQQVSRSYADFNPSLEIVPGIPTDPQVGKGETVMSKRTQINLIALMTLALAALTACGDVNSGDFIIKTGKWPWPWPQQAEFLANDTWSENVPVTTHTRVRLDTVNGGIDVTGSPDAASVMVTLIVCTSV